MNATRLIAATLGKIAVHVADATGQPATLILKTGVFDVPTVGLKERARVQNTRRSITYWIGIRYSTAAILLARASIASANLHDDAPITTVNIMLRRQSA